MEYNTIFYIIIAILVFNYVIERILDGLNSTKWSNKLPDELKGIYDPEEYKKSQDYKRVNEHFSLITGTFSFIVILLMFFLGGFSLVDAIARDITSNNILIALVFFGILMLAFDLITTPFSIYDTFVIEEKFGFNKTTPKTFVMDKIKGWFLGAIIGGAMLALIVWFYQYTGSSFWIYAWIAITLFMVFMSMFYSTLIVPLFNKQTPLEPGPLRNAIEDFSKKVSFKLDNIFVIDGSKRSTKSNAYFSGLGSKKRIVLYDNLINDLKTEEIVAVLAHEIGHYKKKHSLYGIILGIFQTGITLYILSLFVGNPELSEALGTDKKGFHLGLIAFGVLYSPISLVIGLFMNAYSRKNEYSADRFARDQYEGNGENLISALKKLSKKNLSNLTPHPLYVFFYYSHPPLLQRIKAIRERQ